jgi:hypothetical protein
MAQENVGIQAQENKENQAVENAPQELQDWFYYVEIPIIKVTVKDKEIFVSPFGELSFYDTYKTFDDAFGSLYYYKASQGVIEKYIPVPVRLIEPLTQEEYGVSWETFKVSALFRLSHHVANKDIPIVMKISLYDSYSKKEKNIEVRDIIRGYSVKLPIKVIPESPSSVKLLVEFQGKQYVNYRSTFSMRIREWYLQEPDPVFDLLKPKLTNFHTRALRSKEERKIANPYNENYDIMFFLRENQK